MLETYRRRAAAVKDRGRLERLTFHLREWSGLTWAALDSRRGRGVAGRHLRHGARRLARNPGFALVGILTLALGMGGTVAIYAVVDSVILNPLPYPESDELVWMDNAGPGVDAPEGLGFTPGLVYHLSRHQHTMTAMGAFSTGAVTVTGEGDPERVRRALVTPSLGEVLGVPPERGRWFMGGDGAPSGPAVVVLSHALWSRRYGSDPAIVGRSILIDDTPTEVVGVMPPSFRFPDDEVRLWLPLHLDETTALGGFWIQVVGRMRVGITPSEVRSETQALYRGLAESFPDEPGRIRWMVEDVGITALVASLKSSVVGQVARTLWILLGTVGIVLLIACANVANLFLVRAESRQREVAVRGALGAGRLDQVYDALVEGILLSGLGGLVGLVLAQGAVRLLVSHGPATLPRLQEVGVDGSVLVFALGVMTLAGLAFGAIPLLRRDASIVGTLRATSGATADRVRVRGRSVLVAGQMALAVVLLVGSGLMIRSFMHLRAIDAGFDASPDILTLSFGLSPSEYPHGADAAAFSQALVAGIRGLPGVEAAGVVTCLPMDGWCSGNHLSVEGRLVPEGTLPPVVAVRRAGPGYFRAMGIDVLEGRALEQADMDGEAPVVVISQSLARDYFLRESPLGRRVAVESDTTWSTVVGVVEDVPAQELMHVADPLIYFPLMGPANTGVSARSGAVAVRAPSAAGLLSAVRDRVAAVDPDVAIARVRTTDRIVADASARMAFTMVLLVLAGGTALILGVVGIYGVISYLVGRRRAEIGVRMALGARPSEVEWMVVRGGAQVAGVGLAVGMAAAFGLTRLMVALLFDVEPTDPFTYAVVGVGLFGAALLAAWVPARRAASTDPARALRAE
jgi:putative ABC transport system permease protein